MTTTVPTNTVVTGAAGWLGQNLVRALAPERDRVRCFVARPEEAAPLEVVAPSVEVVVGDLRDPAAVDRLFDGISGASVFHAAAVIHPTKLVRDFFDLNVGGTQHVLDRARRAGATRMVHVSSNSPFGANPTPKDRFTEDSPYNPYLGYGRSKQEAEQLVFRAAERGDVAATIVRAPWFYGPFQPARQTQWFSAVRKGRFPLIGDGTQQRSLVDAGNLVHGLLRAEATDAAVGRAYWVADAEPYELGEVLRTVKQALAAEGRDVTDRQPRLPRALGTVAATADALLQDRGRYIQPLHVLGELRDTIACDVSRARAELDYDPSVGLLDGMRASVRWCLERGQSI
ncbi:NAD(P)-dependent oxidoreductase [soil metagenome]